MARGKPVKRSRWYDPDTPKDPDSATRARDRLIKKQARDRYKWKRGEMDVPHSQREIIDRPVTTMAEHLKPPRGAGTKKAVTAGGKATVKAATTGAKGVVKGKGVATKTAGGMAKKAAGWIKRQGFVPSYK